MFHPGEIPQDEEDRRRLRPSITQALQMWGSWHADYSPLGCTGDYALDMQLADAFRHLLYRPALKDRLNWIERELGATPRPSDDRFHAEIISWWLAIWEAEKAPVIENRKHQRELQCASF
jgi:hypothetical protein